MTVSNAVREVANGVYAYLQQGGWGYSNAGLIRGRDTCVLVDTLYDSLLTREMLTQMRRVTNGLPIGTVVNTHANGDHCWGNQAVGNARIVSSRAAAEEMRELPPVVMHLLVRGARSIAGSPFLRRLLGRAHRLGLSTAADLADASEFVSEAFGSFEFGNVRLRVPDSVFEGTLELNVDDKRVVLLEVGPAHTRGDTIVHLVDDRVVFTGDILFMGSHPVLWAGSASNWIDACDRILALDVDVVVPGHGPLTDKQGVQGVRDYWVQLAGRAREAHALGMTSAQLAEELASEYDWSEPERLVVNLDAIYRELRGIQKKATQLSLLAQMGRFARRQREANSTTAPRPGARGVTEPRARL